MSLNIGDIVRWVDDSPYCMPDRWGIVLKISDEPRRDGLFNDTVLDWDANNDLPRMVLIQWERDSRKRWEAPELLVRIES